MAIPPTWGLFQHAIVWTKYSGTSCNKAHHVSPQWVTCTRLSSPGESYLGDTSGNDGVNKLEDLGVNISGISFSGFGGAEAATVAEGDAGGDDVADVPAAEEAPAAE